MKQIFNVSCLLLLGAFFQQAALANTYSITLREFGYNRPNCNESIDAVAKAFADDANVVIIASGCLPLEVGHRSPSGKFTYISPSSVATVSSEARSFWGFDGFHSSYGDCMSALQEERVVFKQQTGLEPFVGYCYRSNSVGAPRYRARLEAVGSSAVRKYLTGATWSHQPLDQVDLKSQMNELIKLAGGQVVASSVDRDISGYLGVTDYYSSKHFHLHAQELLYWRSASECRASANSMNQQWNYNVSPSIFHCSVMTNGVSQLLQLHVSESVMSEFDFDTNVYETAYHSQSTCLADIARIREALEGIGVVFIGATCGQDKSLGSWRLAMFTETKKPFGL